MTWANRFRMWGGVLLVVVVVAALTLLFNQRQGQAESLSASVEAPTTMVSSGYGGIITKRLVSDGDVVAAGQDLFVVTSSRLQQDVAQGVRPGSTVAYRIDLSTGTITYKAVAAGYVTDIVGAEGTFVGDGNPLATIVNEDAKTVEATYRLSPLDYGRIDVGAPVAIHLPNNRIIAGKVSDVAVATDAGEAVPRVSVSSEELNSDGLGVPTRRGTPVIALMHLRDEGPLAGPTAAMFSFLTKIGLR